MSIINSLKQTGNESVKSAENYIKHTQDYLELKMFQQISLIFSLFIKTLLFGGLIFIGLMMFVISGVIKLGEYLESDSLALVYVGLGIFAVSGILYAFRKRLFDTYIIKKMGKAFFD